MSEPLTPPAGGSNDLPFGAARGVPVVARTTAPLEGVRIPRPDDPDPIDATLAAANERGRSDSLRVLGALLPAVPFAELAQTADGSLLAGSCAASTDLRHWVDGFALLDRLLAGIDLSTDHVRLVRDRSDLPLEPIASRVHVEAGLSTRLMTAPLLDQLRAGATLVMNGIDVQDRALTRFMEHAERIFGCQVNLNGYVSLRSDPGFDAHWDDHEVFIIQLIGRKEWEVYEPPVLSPNRLMTTTDAGGQIAWKGLVGPGGVLHVPRGWGHDARATDELSFHLTVGARRVSNLDLVDDALGQYLPTIRSGHALVRDVHALDQGSWRGALRDLAAAISAPDRIASTLAVQLHGIASRQTQSPRSALAALQGRVDPTELFVRSPHPGGVLVGDSEPGTRRLMFGRSDARFTKAASAVLAPRLDGRAHRLADVLATDPVGDASRGVAEAAVRDAIAVGLLEVVEDVHAWGVVVQPRTL